MKYSVFSGVLPELNPKEVVEALSRHGYDGVEWRIGDEYHFKLADIDRRAEHIKNLCADAGLAVSGLTSNARLDDEDSIKRLADAAQIIGCPRFRAFSALYDPAVGYWPLYRDTLAQLRKIEKILEGRGVKLLLEVHFGTIIPSPALAYELIRHCSSANIGVVLDPANTIIEGSMNMRMGLDMLGDYVDHVHVKNTCWEVRDGAWRWRFDEMRDGQLDWADAIAALKAMDYSGYLSFENLYRVPVRHTGYVAEDITTPDQAPRDIDTRLAGDLAYIRELVETVEAI